MQNIKPTSPVMLGLCSQFALDDAIEKAARAADRRRAGDAPAPAETDLPIAEETEDEI
jgi:hypothetical protein